MLKSLEQIKSIDLTQNWVKYLYNTKKKSVNFERIKSLKEINTKCTYNYVLKTLEILDGEKQNYSDYVVRLVEEVLKWCEVSKCGDPKSIKTWKQNKFNLYVHNIGSSQIYKYDNKDYNNVVSILIKTHGLIGQNLRGEILFSKNKELYSLIENNEITKEDLKSTLILLNKCVVGGVSKKIYEKVETEINKSIERIVNNDFSNEFDSITRIKLLNGELSKNSVDELEFLFKNKFIEKRINELFSRLELWFYEGALKDFSIKEQIKILLIIYNTLSKEDKHLTFEEIMKSIYLDYNGNKEVNIYKQRIIESYLESISFTEILNNSIKPNPHISIKINRKGSTIIPIFKFSIQASKLIEFCEVAYTSDSLYNKAVFMLYDLFGFRRDQYDRFYNEINYLNRMNKSVNFKAVILDYLTGKDILDVGPGGGALMNLILEKDSNLNVYGIDIAQNVIDALNKKKIEENKNWNVIKGDALNLEDYLKPNSMDTIIYSSIIHELYSYIQYEGKNFNHDVIIKTLKSAYNVLRRGGRIIIRDGIMTEPVDQMRVIEFRNKEDMEILSRYCNDFKGRNITYQKIDDGKVKMLVNDAMEFLYTYTWGEASYALEVKEQFGYYTPTEYVNVIKENLEGCKIITCNAFLQEGYEENLLNKISIYDEYMNIVKLPNSTCIIVIEKR